ncbi:MAG: DUF4129 domain-containing protein [Lachnospiraceae bacterium]|nr:DUF4129 domain-containing protein [Lachnospiraceae bacterium]
MNRYEEFLQRESRQATVKMQLLRLINYGLLFYTFGILPLFFGSNLRLYFGALIFVAALCTSEAVRYRKVSFLLYCLIHAVLCGLIVLVGIACHVRLYYLALAILLTICAFYAHIRDIDPAEPHPGFLAPYMILFLVALYVGHTPLLRFSYLAEGICAIVYLLYRNEDQLEEHLYRLQEDTAVPVEKIRRTNSFMALLLAIGMAILIALFRLVDYSEELAVIFRKIVHQILLFLLSITRLLFRNNDEAFEEEALGGATLAPMLPGGMSEPSPFMELLFEIIFRIFTLATIILIVTVVLKLLIALYRAYLSGGRKADADRIEYLKPHERREHAPRSASVSKSEGFFSPRTQLRRAYRKWLLKSPKAAALQPSMTPAELEATAYPSHPDCDNETLHRIYEQARYSDKPLQSSDVRAFHDALRAQR